MTNAAGFAQWGATAGRGKNQGDQVIYYRRPETDKDGNPAENAGWITWGDSASGTKLRDFVIRGFEPLMVYGSLNKSTLAKRADEEDWDQARRLWHTILSHPQGPAEFPVDQILTLGWYRPERCPEPGTVFPQLSGQKVREYRCPECNRRPFIDIDGVGGVGALASHLRIMHAWDRSNLMAYGDRIGIDFNKADVNNNVVTEFDIDAAPVAKRPRQAKPVPQVEVETVGA